MKVIGMISGTSFDAIEAVAVELTLESTVLRANLLAHESVEYAEGLRDAVAAVLPPATTTIDEVCRLDTVVGQSFAAVADDVARRYFDGTADVVCSHGQTVFHWVDGGHALGTLQVGQPAWIAERTGATIVSDVRSRDIAAGGHGAPLASVLDVLLLGARPATTRAALNLGGISNMTVVGPDRDPVAFDVGPSNALMDAAVTWLTDGAERFDRDGARAARGRVDDELLAALLAEPYYALSAPKSTGKEIFHLDYVRHHLAGRDVAGDDLLATLTELTVRTVADAVASLGVRDVVASGGGVRNPVLLAGLRRAFGDTSLELIDVLGVPEAAKEALAFAIIGFLTVHGLRATTPSCTGASRATVLGSITPGRQAMVSLGESDAPTSLVVTGGGRG